MKKTLISAALTLCAITGCLPTSLDPLCAELSGLYADALGHIADLECQFLGECGE